MNIKQIPSKIRRTLATGAGMAALLLAAATFPALAQDEGAGGPGGPGGGPGGGGPGGGGGGRGGFNMTPEQLEQRRAQAEKARLDWVKQTFVASGFTDPALGESVTKAMTEREKSRAKLQDMARDIAGLLVDKNSKDSDVKTALEAYRKAVAEDQAIYTNLLADIETKYNTSKTPKLEALLNVLGIQGSETVYLGGLGDLFPDSPYGRAGRMGFNRGGGPGGGGGRGGRGGGGRGGGGGGGEDGA